MSITVTTDVSCDNENCMNWEFGIVDAMMKATEARKNVATKGWTRSKVMGSLIDLCPDCTKKLEDYYKENGDEKNDCRRNA